MEFIVCGVLSSPVLIFLGRFGSEESALAKNNKYSFNTHLFSLAVYVRS
jgi:hypothetical protein